jgi:nucleotide-binding universal stress UspA family protein
MGNRVVVGVDGSESSRRALRWAARQAELTGAALQVVHAWDVPSAYGYVPVVELDWEAEARAELARTVKDALGAEHAGELHGELVRGHAAESLLAASEGADLLVVGSRGRGGFAGMLLGSVSQYLVTHARCPVVVIH